MNELIERRAALTALCEDCLQKHEGICPHPASRCVEFRTIKQLPAIEAEPVRHGRWIPIEYDSYADGAPVWDKWECSECSHEHSGEEDTLTAFCPDCGARMDATDTNVGGKGDEEMDLSPLDFLAAEYDRKHPQGIRFVDCMEGADDCACKKV